MPVQNECRDLIEQIAEMTLPQKRKDQHMKSFKRPGVLVALVSATFGHSGLKVTSVYAHARPEDSSSRFLKR